MALLSMGISYNIYSAKCQYNLDKLSNAFNSICDELEFNGYSSSIKEKIKEYSILYKQKVNVIITDKDGTVIYHLNNAYMPEIDSFYTTYKNGTQYINIVDSLQNIKYTALLDYAFNNYGSPGGNRLNRKMGLLAGRLESISQKFSQLSGEVLPDSEQATIFMQCVLISSKGYSLYSISAYNAGDLVWTAPDIKVFENIGNTLGPILGITLFFFWGLLPIWVFIDAQRRGFKAPLWAILTLLTNIVGLLVYLVVRPEYTICRNCGKQLSMKFVICPYCGTQNREQCPSCKEVLEEEWVACPYCGHIKETKPPDEMMT